MKCIDEPGRHASPAPNELPDPSEAAQAHSESLIERLRQDMAAAGGSIPFDRYMDTVLYAPGLGYYSAGSRKFGPEGDFVTAPELSPLFSQCLARQCAQVLEQTGGDDILEFGAGTGTMAADILLQLERMQALPSTYTILELSADLQQRQRQTLERKAAHLLPRVRWLRQLPESFRGVMLANEVLDAMPVHRLRLEHGNWRELMVGWEGPRLGWQSRPLEDEQVVVRLQGLDLPEAYTTEVCTRSDAWITRLGEILESGLILLIDYGFPRHEYYHPERSQGTLMCHYRHRAHPDPFVYPGLQDITAHVDFTAVAEAALNAGLSVYGYTTQAMFLLATGLEQAMDGVEDAEQQYRLAQQIKTLTLPSEMGELFKVMGLGKGLAEITLMGFALHDMRGKL